MKGWLPSDTLSARLLANAIVWFVVAMGGFFPCVLLTIC